MIGRDEIDAVAADLQVRPTDVERDYVHGWLLAQLFADPIVSGHLVLKGGNALRKGFFANTRYSADLDFVTPDGVDRDRLKQQLMRVSEAVSSATGVRFENDQLSVREKSAIDAQLQVVEARLYFYDFYGKPGRILLKVRMDISEYERLLLEPVARELIHPYSDAPACRSTIKCARVEEILASKLKCLLQRRQVVDLYDYLHWLLFGTEGIDRSLVLTTFLRMTVYGRDPGAALELLLGLPFHVLREAWSQYVVAPIRSRFSFDDAIGRFAQHLKELFRAYDSPHPRWNRLATFFPSELRNVILEAGSRTTLMRVEYDGTERLIEPYSLRFKQRRDGVGREYLYCYDQTGGRESPPGIKTFVSEKCRSAEVTDTRFEPRFEVEVAKAGDAALAGHFSARWSVPSFGKRRPRASGPVYLFRCITCHRIFAHRSLDSTLRSHRTKDRATCFGTYGSYVRTRW